MEHKPASSQKGIIQSVRGSVVDIRFEEDIPGIYTMLRTGNEGEVVIEVLLPAKRGMSFGAFP
jgi:F-type H+-transporting ATPase subunit beta